ncbi:MAG: hypothetical protein WD063_14180 [Pirellulales bacterium]
MLGNVSGTAYENLKKWLSRVLEPCHWKCHYLGMAKKKEQNDRSEIHALAAPVGERLGADVIVYAGGTYPADDETFNKLVRAKVTKKNVLVLLTTFGGSADSAYRIGRCLQEVYKHGTVMIFVDTYCKSAGTILAVAADEIIMSDCAEFGPIDVQLRKPDEVGERMSGLTATQALSTLQAEAYAAFEAFFIGLRGRTQISTKIASDVAAQLTVGLFSEIYAQIEPMRLGENQRAMQIAEQYGNRLSEISGNVTTEALEKLLGGYPSHEFVIDRSEAGKLFTKLRSPDSDEQALATATQTYTVPTAIRATEDFRTPALIDIVSIPPPIKDLPNDRQDDDSTSSDRPVSENPPPPNGGGDAHEGNPKTT